MKPDDIKELINFGEELANLARESVLKYFRRLESIDYKRDRTPVTVADREAESVIRQRISQLYPTHGIVGEEYGHTPADGPWCWVIDPIDGTRSFVAGRPTFGCLIAVLHDNQPILGIIDMPALNERWTGVNREPTFYNGEPCATSKCNHLPEAIVFATSMDMFTEDERKQFDRLSGAARFRSFGADCYAYGLLSSGYIDVVMESDMFAYDYLALVAVVEGSGGCISDWQGRPLDLSSGKQVLATASQELHQQCLNIIGSGRSG